MINLMYKHMNEIGIPTVLESSIVQIESSRIIACFSCLIYVCAQNCYRFVFHCIFNPFGTILMLISS